MARLKVGGETLIRFILPSQEAAIADPVGNSDKRGAVHQLAVSLSADDGDG